MSKISFEIFFFFVKQLKFITFYFHTNLNFVWEIGPVSFIIIFFFFHFKLALLITYSNKNVFLVFWYDRLTNLQIDRRTDRRTDKHSQICMKTQCVQKTTTTSSPHTVKNNSTYYTLLFMLYFIIYATERAESQKQQQKISLKISRIAKNLFVFLKTFLNFALKDLPQGRTPLSWKKSF